jgi:hypothetical protein
MRPASIRPVKNNNIPLYAQHPLDKNDIKRINKRNINDNDLIYICTNEINKFKPKIQIFLKAKLNERYGELRELLNFSEPWRRKRDEKRIEIEKYNEKYNEKANNNFKNEKPGRQEEMEAFLVRLKEEEVELNKKFEEAREIKRHYDNFKDENATDLEKKEAEEIIERLIPGYIKNKESYEKIQTCWETINKKPEEPMIEIYGDGEGLYADLPLNSEGGRKTRKKRKHSHLRSKKHRLRI